MQFDPNIICASFTCALFKIPERRERVARSKENARLCYVIAYVVRVKFTYTIVSDFLVDMHHMACIVALPRSKLRRPITV